MTDPSVFTAMESGILLGIVAADSTMDHAFSHRLPTVGPFNVTPAHQPTSTVMKIKSPGCPHDTAVPPPPIPAAHPRPCPVAQRPPPMTTAFRETKPCSLAKWGCINIRAH